MADVLYSVFGDVFGGSYEPFAKARTAMPGAPKGEPQALDHDPFDEVMFQMYSDASNGRGLTYETRRGMASAPQIAPAINMRVNQACKFTRAPRTRYDFGVALELREARRAPTKAEIKAIEALQRYIATCGVLDDRDPDARYKRDSFRTFTAKVCRDSLTHDAMVFEVIEDRRGLPSWFQAVDATTVRRWEPGTGPQRAGVDYVQFVRDEIRAEWPARRLAFGVRRPRSDIRANGYGFPELDELFVVVTGLLNSLDYNMNYFKQGSTTKGILKIIGNIPAKQLRAFKRFWATMVAGLQNAWRTPIINVPSEKGDVSWVPMSQSNRDMEWSMFNEFLMWLAFFHYGIDGVEAGLKYGGASGNKAMFESDNEARLRLSRERGLEPMMLTLEDLLNLHVIWRINPDLQLRFTGLTSLSERERVELDQKRVSTYVTLNEIRKEDDREAIDGGDIVLNQVYTQALQMQQGAGAGDAEEGDQGPEGLPAAGAEASGDDESEDIPEDDYDDDDDVFGSLFRPAAEAEKSRTTRRRSLRVIA